MTTARWFLDENNLLLARRLGEDHVGVVYPGHPDIGEVPRGSADEVWLEVVGRRGLVVITRDKRIRYRPVERQRWIDHQVRGFVLTSAGNLRVDAQVALLSARWDAIERFVDRHAAGPWMCSLTQSGIRELIERSA